MTFGRLTVLRRASDYVGSNGKKRSCWWCMCSCEQGTVKVIRGSHLTTDKVISCGCYNNEKRFKHGLSDKRLYKIYKGMVSRCCNAEDINYSDYGGRGISICSEWLGDNGLVNFYNWALKNGYEDGLTLDRINVNGNYEPSNCRWATLVQQGNNKRNNRLVTINGKTRTVTEWAALFNLSPMTIRSRLRKGWKEEHILLPAGGKSTRKQSGVKGIHWSTVSNKWTVYIFDKNNKRKYVGLYVDLDEAIEVQNELQQELI